MAIHVGESDVVTETDIDRTLLGDLFTGLPGVVQDHPRISRTVQ